MFKQVPSAEEIKNALAKLKPGPLPDVFRTDGDISRALDKADSDTDQGKLGEAKK